jgi:very-short-patch-repair endonuclease
VTIEGPGKEYRPDFIVYFRGGAIAVELDGHEAHASRPQRQRDAEKDRWLERHGFRTARWTGTDVHADARACVIELVELVRTFERREI